MNEVRFDPEVVRLECARRIADARWLPRNWALMGALLGYVLGASVAGGLSIAAGVTSLVVLAMGMAVGREQASRARVDAHLALCQLEVESHTRGWLSEARVSLRQLAQAAPRTLDVEPRTEPKVAADGSGARRPLDIKKVPEVVRPFSDTSGSRSGSMAALRRPQATSNTPEVSSRPGWEEVPLPVVAQPATTYLTFAPKPAEAAEAPVDEVPVADAVVPVVHAVAEPEADVVSAAAATMIYVDEEDVVDASWSDEHDPLPATGATVSMAAPMAAPAPAGRSGGKRSRRGQRSTAEGSRG